MFTLYAQPIMNIQQSEVFGVEITMRLQQGRKFISAEDTIHMYRSKGSLPALDNAVHYQAIAEFHGLETMFLNCETETLFARKLQFPKNVDLTKIVIEITERTSINPNQVSEVVEFLEPYRAGGLRVAIDDFGRGTANFDLVAALEPEFIKIDRSVLQQVGYSERYRRFVRGLLSFSRYIGSAIITEGIETPEQHLFLQGERVQFAQGYYYGRPTLLNNIQPIANS